MPPGITGKGYLQSKASYKKLGTIIEHLTKNVNLMQYQIGIRAHFNGVSIQIWPLMNASSFPQWEIIWYPSFNAKILIDPYLLHQNAEW